MPCRADRAERGSALLLVVVVTAALAWAAVRSHLAATALLQRSRADLAMARARQAAASGLAHALTSGLPAADRLPGGARWEADADSSAPGFVVWRSRGYSGQGAPPSSELWALERLGDSGSRVVVHQAIPLRR